ncbi:ribbon-helix-helix domain-containing protein [Nanoarchaeota archaeon]
MVMDTLQIRLSHGLVERVDDYVKDGIYANRSDVIRDAVRRFVWERELGSIPNRGDSVKQIRKAREALSKEKIDLDEVNKL